MEQSCREERGVIESTLTRIADSLERIAAALEATKAPPVIKLPTDRPPAAGDVLMGANAIAHETGLKVNQVYRLADSGKLPTFKLGGVLAARRSELEEFLSAERQAA